MKDKLKPLTSLREMHSFQVIALVGFIMSAGAQGLMLLLDKQVASFGYIYPSWVVIFLIGYLLAISGSNSDHHHHH